MRNRQRDRNRLAWHRRVAAEPTPTTKAWAKAKTNYLVVGLCERYFEKGNRSRPRVKIRTEPGTLLAVFYAQARGTRSQHRADCHAHLCGMDRSLGGRLPTFCAGVADIVRNSDCRPGAVAGVQDVPGSG